MCDSCDDMGVLLNGPRRFPLPMGVIEAESHRLESTAIRLQAFLSEADQWRIDAAAKIKAAVEK